MVKWNKKLYMDEKAKKRIKRYKKKIEKPDVKFALKGFFLITKPANEKNCFDIYRSGEFWLEYRKHSHNLEIVGLATSSDSLYELVSQITRDVIDEYGEMNSENAAEFFKD